MPSILPQVLRVLAQLTCENYLSLLYLIGHHRVFDSIRCSSATCEKSDDAWLTPEGHWIRNWWHLLTLTTLNLTKPCNLDGQIGCELQLPGRVPWKATSVTVCSKRNYTAMMSVLQGEYWPRRQDTCGTKELIESDFGRTELTNRLCP